MFFLYRTFLFRPKRFLGGGMLLFGLALFAFHYFAVGHFFSAHVPNRLPPAGSFFPGPSSFSFAVMGDSGMRNTPMEKIFSDVRDKNMPFLLNVGDTARFLNSSHFEWILEELDEDLDGIPLYSVPGNHDVMHSINDVKVDDGRFYTRAFGQRYYWFSYGATLFLGMDNANGGLGEKQLLWANQVLEKLRDDFSTCIIFIHKPPVDPRPGKHYDMHGNDVPELRELVDKYKVDLILCGHIHEYWESQFGNAKVVTVPPSGQEMRGDTTQYGYVICNVDNESQTITCRKVPVTANSKREHLEIFIAGGWPGISLFPWIAILLVIVGTKLLAGKRLPELEDD